MVENTLILGSKTSRGTTWSHKCERHTNSLIMTGASRNNTVLIKTSVLKHIPGYLGILSSMVTANPRWQAITTNSLVKH